MSWARLPTGGRIDRARPLSFAFNDSQYTGFAGDTLASALLANGVDIISRGIYTGRPRGIMSAGPEESNAFVEVGWPGGWSEPMLRATQVELVDGLWARAERGRGRLSIDASEARFEGQHAHCDILVIGGGPAGLMAALAAGRSGARVILVDEQPQLGGALLGSRSPVNDGPASDWVERVTAQLAAAEEVRILRRSTALAYHDHQYVVVAERRPTTGVEGRLWHLRAREVILATGAHERPIVFADNDRPGIMLASAASTYVNRFAVRPGTRAVVFTTNDSAIVAARELADAGLEITAVVDTRKQQVVTGTVGDDRLEGAIVDGRVVACDLLAVSGGWNPAVHLFSQSRGTVRYDQRLAAYIPDRPFQATHVVGAARGSFGLAECLREGAEAGAEAARSAGFGPGAMPPLPVVEPETQEASQAVWLVPSESGSWDSHFVDLARDATVADLRRAADAGLQSIEHIKRFTTIGTASDQGKTSWMNASAIAAALMGVAERPAGLPTFRPPYTPVSFALLAGRERGLLHDPVRTTPIHPWHVANGAVFEDVGQWQRPRYYPHRNERMEEAVLRECGAARTGVAIMDASTLGKIDLQGPDTGEFLNRVYTNAFAKLPVGSCRYGVMCRLDGMVFDDGVTSRIADDRYLMTTTTGNAAAVLDWLEEWLQTEWPELRVHAASVTEQWATIAVVGPRSREVIQTLAPSLAVDAAAFPFMTWRPATVAGVPARIFRISFSGELAFEINVPSWHGEGIWDAVMAAGQSLGITPYGTEALHVLRAEKGYPIIGQETDGSVTPQDLGMDWIVSKNKSFIGSRSHRRPDTARADRRQLVALLPLDANDLLPEGAQLVMDPDQPIPMRMVGHVTSSYRSAVLRRTFALALVSGGRGLMGRTVYAPLADRTVAAIIAHPVLYDPENLRRDG
ncbi:MAG: 2Fe-2S iron-sulfur cluster-binding protein [Vicinamibacterales bacterium]